MEGRKRFRKRIAYSVIAVFLAALLVLPSYVSLLANIRFSRQKYVEDTAKYAALLTDENTEYLSEGRVERAWKILRSIIKRPETYSDYDLYASIAIAREDFDGAAEYLQGCIDTCEGSDKDLSILHLRLGSLHILREDPTQAMKELNKAIDLNSSLASAYYLRGRLYAEDSKAEMALKDYRTFVNLDGHDPLVAASLGEVFEGLDELELAIRCYTDGINAPSGAEVKWLADRARCEVKRGNLTAAKSDLENYFHFTDADPGGLSSALLGMCRMNDGQYAEAAECFHQAADNGYEDLALLYEQSLMCLYAAGEYQAAVADGEKGIAAAKDAERDITQLCFWTGMAYLAQGLYQKAAALFKIAAEKDPDLDNIDYYQGVCALAEDEYEIAEKFFTASIAKENSKAESLYNRAICYIQLDRLYQAMEDLKEAAGQTEATEVAEDAAELLRELEGVIAGT